MEAWITGLDHEQQRPLEYPRTFSSPWSRNRTLHHPKACNMQGGTWGSENNMEFNSKPFTNGPRLHLNFHGVSAIIKRFFDGIFLSGVDFRQYFLSVRNLVYHYLHICGNVIGTRTTIIEIIVLASSSVWSSSRFGLLV